MNLCPRCRHHNDIHNDRGSVFLMCMRSFAEPEYPKYPRLPVLACQGYEERHEERRDAHCEPGPGSAPTTTPT